MRLPERGCAGRLVAFEHGAPVAQSLLGQPAGRPAAGCHVQHFREAYWL